MRAAPRRPGDALRRRGASGAGRRRAAARCRRDQSQDADHRRGRHRVLHAARRERPALRPIRRGSRLRCRRSCRSVNVKVISLAKPRQTAADMAERVRQGPQGRKTRAGHLADRHLRRDARRRRGKLPDDARRRGRQTPGGRRGRHLHEHAIQPAHRSRDLHDALRRADPLGRARHAVNVFDRQAIMRHWGELGTFDLLAATKSLDTAAKVHDCFGRCSPI